MKDHKLLFFAIGAFIALFAAAAAIAVFKNEIMGFFITLKDKFDEHRVGRRCVEFSDFADV